MVIIKSKTILVTQTGFVNYMICHANLLTYKEKDVVITLDVNIIYDIEIEEKAYSLLKIAVGDIND